MLDGLRKKSTAPKKAPDSPGLPHAASDKLQRGVKSSGSAVIVGLLGTCVYGAGTFVWQTPVLLDETIRVSLQLTEEQMIETDSLIFMGWAIGAVVGGRLTDTIGRKPVSLISGFLIILHLLVSASAAGLVGLTLARFVGGVAIGGTAAGFTLGVEHVEASRRSATATHLNVYNHAGGYFILTAIHVACASRQLSWQSELVAFAAALTLLLTTTALVVPESPEWLARRSKPLTRSWPSTAKPSSPKAAADDATDDAGMMLLLDGHYRGPTAQLTLCFVAGVVRAAHRGPNPRPEAAHPPPSSPWASHWCFTLVRHPLSR